MHRKVTLSLFIAVALMMLLAAAVGAQDAPEGPVGLNAPSVEPFSASITQAVPLTLTINISGPNGIETIEVPVMLNLDIRLAFTNVLTTSVTATTEVGIPAEAAATEVAAEEETPAATPAATAVPPTPTRAAPTATPAPPTPRPLAPTAAPAPTEEAEATATPATEEEEEVIAPPAACPDPRAAILSPGANEVISGTIEVFGTAQHETFQYYKLEYALGAGVDPAGEFAYITDVSQSVVDGLLATVDTTTLDNGAYTLRLTVVDRTGNFPPPCTVTVEIAN